MKNKYFIAKTVTNQEFLFSRSSIILVPTASAKKICDTLNGIGYNIDKAAGEKWHLYEIDDLSIMLYANREIKAFNGKRLQIHYI